MTRKLWVSLSVVLLSAVQLSAEENLTDLSLEELLTVEITSVAKKRQRVEDAAAAVFVISSEDIRRSGATRITDLFRMVPGVQVGENDSNSVAVSARGFNERFSNKLLVLVDGRAVYRSVLSGVFWDQILVPLQEIERIEVVRGPGATIWGANAVNGVINIITKHPIDTQGGTVALGGGTNELGRAYARWGGLLGDEGAFRFYARGDVREGLVDEVGDQINENARSLQSGFRVDWEPTERDSFTFQGDVQRGDFESIADISSLLTFGVTSDATLGGTDLTTDEDFQGFNLLGRWARTGTAFGDFSLQIFGDFLDRGEFGASIASSVSGVEFQHTLNPASRHEIIWGANFQVTTDRVDPSIVQVGEGTEINTLFGLFAQDEIELVEDELSLTLGTKIEHNTFSGVEFQPSARLFWRPSPDLAVWGAVSRAVRTPALFEEEISTSLPPIPPFSSLNPTPSPVNVGLLGSEDLEAEELLAFEIGTRFSLPNDISIDLAAYYNRYDELIVLTQDPVAFGPEGISQTVSYANAGEARTFGAEIAAEWQVSERWALKGAYSYQNIDFREDGASIDASGRIEGLTPVHQGSIRSQFDITDDVEFDLWLRGQTGLTESGVDGFADLDARLSWRPRPDLELSISGRNLLQSRRQDFKQSFYPAPPGQVERMVFGAVEFRF
ncbi:MAG: TonB-dependent receptor [Pseudomonadota bacterium]